MKKIIAKGIENVVDALGNKIGALPNPDVSTQKGRLQYYLKNLNIGDNEAIRLNKLPAYGEDDLSKYVPERRGKFALMPENWESTYYSLTNKDFSKVKNYKPEVLPIPKNSLVGDMAIANKFYRAKDETEKTKLAQEYKDSLTQYGEDISHIKMPEILLQDEASKIGALPSTRKNISEYSDIIDQSVRLDTPDAFKNIFHQDKEFAKGYGGELKSGALKFGSEDMPPSLTDKELADAQKEIQELTQDYLKDLPEEITVYRYGDLDNESGVSSFTLNPNYNADLSLPWQKRLQSPLQAFKVNKKDILASPDINAFFGGGRTFDEQEVIISNDKVKVK